MPKSAQIGDVAIKRGQSFDFFNKFYQNPKFAPISRPNPQFVHFLALIFFILVKNKQLLLHDVCK